MTIKFANMEACEHLAEAMLSETADPNALALAWAGYSESIANELRAEFEQYGPNIDAAAMESRGYRVLTAKEKAWYEKVSQALRDAKTEQAFIDIIGTDDQDTLMPPTIIQDVFSDIQKESKLLAKVGSQYVGYATKFIMNDASIQMGAWGKVTDAITKEIEGAIKVISMEQSRYTAFCIIPLDVLDMGPEFVDAFIRALMAESMLYGLEQAVVNGSGVNMPIGMMRDPEGSFSQTTGYPAKTAVKVTSFAPAEYGELLADLAETPTGRQRVFDEVILVTNMSDYLTKIMPATTVQSTMGGYVSTCSRSRPTPSPARPCRPARPSLESRSSTSSASAAPVTASSTTTPSSSSTTAAPSRRSSTQRAGPTTMPASSCSTSPTSIRPTSPSATSASFPAASRSPAR